MWVGGDVFHCLCSVTQWSEEWDELPYRGLTSIHSGTVSMAKESYVVEFNTVTVIYLEKARLALKKIYFRSQFKDIVQFYFRFYNKVILHAGICNTSQLDPWKHNNIHYK